MRILTFTDNHYGQYSSVVRDRGPVYSVRLHNQADSLNWAADLAVEKKCDMIVCDGDFFDKPELNAEELTALQEIKWADLPYYFIVGNHEMGLNDLSFSSTHLLKMIPNAKIIDKPYYESGFGYRLYFIPYIVESSKKTLAEYIKDLNQGVWETQEVKNTIVFSHNDIAGIRYGKHMSKFGFDINDITNNCDLYINGHLHNQTQVNEKIINLGNLTGQNFSEDAEKFSHCVAIIDTDTLQVELINNPYAFNFYKFDINSKDDIDACLKKCNEYSVISFKVCEELLLPLKERLDGFKCVGYRITLVPTVKKIAKQDINTIVKTGHVDQFKKYIIEHLDNTQLLEDELALIS